MILTIASGKGGTGKTLLATGLARVLTEDERMAVHLVDCDVEAPNAHLFLHPELDAPQDVTTLVPRVDAGRCTLCGRCAQVCAFHALAVMPDRVLVFDDLCHGCGSCAHQCPERAIAEEPLRLGQIASGPAGRVRFTQGLLDVGRAMSTPIIRALKQQTAPQGDEAVLVLRDAPPGNACPVVETLRGSDYALLVTEPTPFGLHDLELAVAIARDELGLPTGVVINRDGMGDGGVEAYCARAGVPILLRIPLDRRIAEVCSDGALWVKALPEYRAPLCALYDTIQAQIEASR
jgi:MinD superfamily P-loop ATPase